MVRSKCPICDSRKLRLFHDRIRGDKPLGVIECRACGTMHLDKKFNQQELNAYYVAEFRKTFSSEIGARDSAEKFFKDQLPLARKRVRLSLPYLAKLGSQAACLEIGCGPGYFLSQLRRFTRNLYGLELNTEHAAYARALGLDVRTEPLDKVRFDTKFDVAFLFHVLEHIADPPAYLASVKELLSPRGRIVIEVPCIRDPLIKLYRIPAFRSFYFQEPHLYYFSHESFGVMARKLGMRARFFSYSQYGLINHLAWALTGKSNVTKRAEGNTLGIELENDRYKVIVENLNRTYLSLLKKAGLLDTLFVVLSR